MGRVLLLLLLIHLALAFAAIVDCLGGEEKPQRLSRLSWSLIAVFGLLAGPIAWFTYGRPGPKLALPWSEPARSRPVAPDDDPEFLAELDRRSWRKPEPERKRPSPGPHEHADTPDDPDSDTSNDTTPDERNNGTG